jgi:hypothetical protein
MVQFWLLPDFLLRLGRAAAVVTVASVAIAQAPEPAAAEIWTPTTQEARELCDAMADADTRMELLEDHAVFRNFRYELPNRSPEAVFDFDNDGDDDVLVSVRAGTANGLMIRPKGDGYQELYSFPSVDAAGGTNNVDREADMYRLAYGKDFLEIDDHYYLFFAWDDFYREPAALTIITADGVLRSLCRFSNVRTFEPTPESAIYCRRLLKQRDALRLDLESLREDDRLLSIYPDKLVSGVRVWGMEVEGAITIDINRDGIEERLLSPAYHIGAGRGCSLAYFDLAQSDARGEEETQRLRSALLKAQRIEHDPISVTPGCNAPDAGVREILVYRDQVLFFSPGSFGRNAAISRIYPGGGDERLCEFATVFKTTVAEYFDPPGHGE